MVAKILDGKALAAKINKKIASDVDEIIKEGGAIPGLATVLVGDDAGSKIYVSMKQKACREVGFYSEEIKLREDTSEDELLDVVDSLNKNRKIHGVLSYPELMALFLSL